MPQGIFIALDEHIRKEKRFKFSDPKFHLKRLEVKKKVKSKCRRKDVTK